MGKTSAEVTNRYRKKTYDSYQFNVRKDDPLNDKLNAYKQTGSLSELIRTLLEEHFAKQDK